MGEVRGRLAIGVIPTVAAIDVPATLRRFHDKHPVVRIKLRVGASDALTQQIAAGELDVAFLGLPDRLEPAGVRSKVLNRDRHVAVVPASHPLADRPEVTLAELADSAFADFPHGSPGRAQSDQAFAASEVRRDVAFEVTSAELMIGLIRQGLAVGMLPSAYVDTAPDLALLPVVDGPRRIEYLAWSDFNPSPATRAFLDVLEVEPAAS